MCPRPQYSDLVYMRGTRCCGPTQPISNTDGPNRSLFIKFEVRSTLRSNAIVITTYGRSERHSSNVIEFRADQMSPTNLRSYINISRYPAWIDKTNIPSINSFYAPKFFIFFKKQNNIFIYCMYIFSHNISSRHFLSKILIFSITVFLSSLWIKWLKTFSIRAVQKFF